MHTKEGVYPHHSIKKVTACTARNQIHIQKSEPSGSTNSPQHSPILPGHSPAVNGNNNEVKVGHRTVNSLAKVFDSKPADESLPESTADHRLSYPRGKVDPGPHTKPLPQTPPQLSKEKLYPSQGKPNTQPTNKPLFPIKGHHLTNPPTLPVKPGSAKQGGVAFDGITESNEKTFLKSIKSAGKGVSKGLFKNHSSGNGAAANDSSSSSRRDTNESLSGRIRNLEASGVASSNTNTSTSGSDKSPPLLKSGSEDVSLGSRLLHRSTDRHRARADSDGSRLSPKNIKKPLVPMRLPIGEDREPVNEYDQPTSGSVPIQQRHFKHKSPQLSSANRGLKTEKKMSVDYENLELKTQADSPINTRVTSEYENVEIGGAVYPKVPQSPKKSSNHDSSAAHTPGDSRKPGASELFNKGEYENVKLPPKPAHFASTPPSKPPHSATPSSNGEYEVVNFLGKSQEEKVDPESDEDTLFGQDGPPGLQSAIYENFGPDEGNKLMSVDDLDKHVRSKGKDGLSAEYLKIKNEPLCGPYTSCK